MSAREEEDLEYLDALPEGSVIRGKKNWHVAVKLCGGWVEVGEAGRRDPSALLRWMPVSLLWRPKE